MNNPRDEGVIYPTNTEVVVRVVTTIMVMLLHGYHYRHATNFTTNLMINPLYIVL